MSGHHAKHASHPHKHRHAHHAPASTAFIQQAAPAARISEGQTGVPASVTIAQAALESGWGRYHMGKANNYFGIKAQKGKNGAISYGSVANGSVEMPTTEYVKGKKVHVNAPFRSYKTMADSFVDHGLFLKNNPRYAPAFAAADADAFAHAIQKAGYATDPHYASMLISIMKSHNLYQYNLKKP